MAALTERLTGRLQAVRQRRPFLDHLVRMQEHYGAVTASQQAGAITYFAFLSFFPVLALAVFCVGLLAGVYPDAQDQLVETIDQLIPGLVGTEDGQISLADVERFQGLAGLVGLVGVLYAGLGWIGALREALEVVFEQPRWRQPGFVAAKLRDLVSLLVIGVVLFVSVVVAGFLTGFSTDVLDWLGLDDDLGWLLYVVTRVAGLVVNALLFFVIFRLVARPRTPARSLWQGAALGGIAFEVLKAVSFLVLGSAKGSPAFQAFGVALVLVVWMNYFSRVVLYAAAFAHTSPQARAQRAAEAPPTVVQGPQTPSLAVGEPTPAMATGRPAGAFLAGAATMVAAFGIFRKWGRS